MILTRKFCVLIITGIFLVAGCGYRFVGAYSGEGFSLDYVKNITHQPRLVAVFEDALAEEAGLFRKDARKKLAVVVDSFSDETESVSASGTPLRQKLTMSIQWRILGESGDVSSNGKIKRSRTYPHFTDLVSLDWQRNAAIRMLARDIMRDLSDRLGELD
ncbi:MAG: hypothetical protein ACC669_02335 [bacterium]